MSLDRVLGQERPKKILQKAFEAGRISHAYLFNGPAGVGKEAMAIEFAKMLFCTDAFEQPCQVCPSCKRIQNFEHPDFHFVFPAPKSMTIKEETQIQESVVENPYLRKTLWANPTIGIEKIRELRKLSVLKPLEGKRIVIIAEAEKMTTEASNSLLKILEEPPESMFLILTTTASNALLDTINSRCQEIRFGVIPDDLVQNTLVEKQSVESEKAKLFARISQGSYRRALEWMDEDIEERRSVAVDFLRTCLKDDLQQFDLVDSLTKNYDKAIIKDILGLMLLWFRDALVLSEDENSQDHVINTDSGETLQKFVGAFESINYDKAISEIENSLWLIDRNVQIGLILIVLLARLNGVFKIRGSV